MLLPLGFLALLVTVCEQTRGWMLASRDEKLRLRALWRGWPSGNYGRFAFHEASVLTRDRLRRSAAAQVVFLVCFALAMSVTAAMAWPIVPAQSAMTAVAGALILLMALAALGGAAVVVRSLLKP